MIINIARDYTDTPGGRNISDGEFSGEDFRDNFLIPKIVGVINTNEKIDIDLDGGYGYGSSFLEEAFGGLIRKMIKQNTSIDKIKDIINRISIKSDDEPSLISQIVEYMKSAVEEGSKKWRKNIYQIIWVF